MSNTRYALISVADTTGIVDFTRGLRDLGFRCIATTGTATHLREEGIEVRTVEEVTGSPVLFGGRVKTLHPAVFAGILARRENETDRIELRKQGWNPIDIVVVNLTQPRQASRPLRLECINEYMDIGGHALLRAAAKNIRDVCVVANPARYELVLGELRSGGGVVSDGLRARLAKEALEIAIQYDTACHEMLKECVAPPEPVLPAIFVPRFRKIHDLRYGENPHQRAAVYQAARAPEASLTHVVQLQGKELSYNNYVDLDAALKIVKEFEVPACVIIKHMNPCGVALGASPAEAYRKARETDPDSAFGGIVGLNVPLDGETATMISEIFTECIVAPGFTQGARDRLRSRKNLRLLELPGLIRLDREVYPPDRTLHWRQISGGALLQEPDTVTIGPSDLVTVTEAQPAARVIPAIFFAWTVVKNVSSNAVVIARDRETVGIGAGQMSRIDSARLAVKKARKELAGAIAASDGFIPFRDTIDELATAGIRAIIQPGGSKRDNEVIAACNERNIALVLTGKRCFKH